MKKFNFSIGLFNKIKIFLILVSHFKFETNWLASLAAAEWLGTFDSETSVLPSDCRVKIFFKRYIFSPA